MWWTPLTGRIEALMERNEALMSSAAMDDNNTYSMHGTPSQIASTLNGINGGTTWDRPARVVNMRPSWQNAPLPNINLRVPRLIADGGKLGNVPVPGIDNTETNDLLRQVVNQQGSMRAEIAAWDRNVKAMWC